MTDNVDESSRTREALIVDAFVHLADTLVDDYDVIDFLHYLTATCVRLVDVDEAAVMLAAPSQYLQAVASSSERSRLLELFELQNRDGPCLDAFRSGQVVSADDLESSTQRWPTFAPQAVKVGFRAVHSVPLRLRRQIVGALNLMRIDPGSLSEVDAHLAGALADVATIGLLQQRQISAERSTASGLSTALTSRIQIEQAKGIVAERQAVTIDEAFELLRSYARSHRLGLTLVAADVINRRVDVTADHT